MKLIKANYEILTPINGDDVLKTIEKVARTCYKSEDKITEDSANKMVQTLISRGHEAMIEFFDITVKFVCDRGVSHELVRHRIASFAQESTRYVNYSKGQFEGHLTFIIPEWCKTTEGLYEQPEDPNRIHDIGEPNYTWVKAMYLSEKFYLKLIADGWQPQQARSVLPNSLKTEINIKMNLREWRYFFKLRTALAAHPSMREITRPLLDELKTKIPIVFDDITY
jgi:thymidylate synthase (FAD)